MPARVLSETKEIDAVGTRTIARSLFGRARTGLAACCVVTAILCVLGNAAASWSKPQLNWDMLAYVAIVHSWTDSVPAHVHAGTYADAARFAESRGLEKRMAMLSEGVYREAVASDVDTFYEQLPFYRIRPLYVLVVAAFAKVTATVSGATIVVSVLSYALCGLGILWFAVRRVGVVAGSVAGIVFAVAPTSTDVAGLSTPDALLMLLTAAAAMLFLGQRVLLAVCLLTVGVLIRTDLQLFNLCLAAAWLFLAWKRDRAILVAAILAGSVVAGMAINAWAGNYGYAVLYHFTFVESFIPHPTSLRGLGIPLLPFLKNIGFGLRYSLGNGGLWAVAVLLGLCGVLLERMIRDGFLPDGSDKALGCKALLIAIGTSTCARFILFPSHDIRLSAPAVAILTIVLLVVAARVRPVVAA